jgi:hypothetical protein
MAEDLPNLGKLIKLLKMTTSSNDAEALAFLRKANLELAKFGGDWESLLRGKVTVIGDPFEGVSAPSVASPPHSHYRYSPPPPKPQPSYQHPPQQSHKTYHSTYQQMGPTGTLRRTKAKVRVVPTVDML